MFAYHREANYNKTKTLSIFDEPIFFRDIESISLDFNKTNEFSSSFIIEWLTISNSKAVFKNMNIQCKIQVTGNSTIIAENCSFRSYDNCSECPIEIFANSSGIFRNCRFNANHSTKPLVIIRNNSDADFINCQFENISDTSILVIDRSFTNICNCKFKPTKQNSVHLSEHSAANIYNSQFLFQEGNAILLKGECHAKIKKCKFKNCKRSEISIDDSSKIHVKKCEFYNLVHIFINLSQNKETQQIFIWKCDMKKRKRKGVNNNINREIQPIDTNFPNNENDQNKMIKIDIKNCLSNYNFNKEEEDDDVPYNIDLKLEAIRRFNWWFSNEKTNGSYETFQNGFRYLSTSIIYDQTELYLARTVYILYKKGPMKLKKCTFDELRDFYNIKNFESMDDTSRSNMKDLIDKIKDNVEDYKSIFDLHVYVLLFYIFRCLFTSDIIPTESCSNDDDYYGIYCISHYIQLDNIENTRNQISCELDID